MNRRMVSTSHNAIPMAAVRVSRRCFKVFKKTRDCRATSRLQRLWCRPKPDRQGSQRRGKLNKQSHFSGFSERVYPPRALIVQMCHPAGLEMRPTTSRKKNKGSRPQQPRPANNVRLVDKIPRAKFVSAATVSCKSHRSIATCLIMHH